jgi:serine/threonine protein kinase
VHWKIPSACMGCLKFLLVRAAFSFVVTVPNGPLNINKKLYKCAYSSVYEVFDENKKPFNIRVFRQAPDHPKPFTAYRLNRFKEEQDGYKQVTHSLCPGLLEGTSTGCLSHNMDIAIAFNVTVANPLDPLFEFNILTPAHDGIPLRYFIDSLPDLFSRYSFVQSILMPQLSNSIRNLHEKNLVHLGIQPDSVLISETQGPLISDHSHVKLIEGDGFEDPFIHEIFQSAVDHNLDTTDVQEYLNSEIQKYPIKSWSDVKSVDFYGLGGTLFFALTKTEPVAEELIGDKPITKYFLSHSKLPAVMKGKKLQVNKTLDTEILKTLSFIDRLLQKNRDKRIPNK